MYYNINISKKNNKTQKVHLYYLYLIQKKRMIAMINNPNINCSLISKEQLQFTT